MIYNDVGSFACDLFLSKPISKESRYYDEQQVLDHLSFMAILKKKINIGYLKNLDIMTNNKHSIIYHLWLY